MALRTEELKAELKDLYKSTQGTEGDAEAALEAFVEGLGNLLESYVKSATVTYSGGLLAPNGAVSGTFNHTIS